MINGTSWLVVTKLDVLDEQPEIPVCVSYKIDGKETQQIPAQISGYEKIEPVYNKLAGMADEHVRRRQLRSAAGKGEAVSGVRREGVGREGCDCLHRPGPRADDLHAGVRSGAGSLGT